MGNNKVTETAKFGTLLAAAGIDLNLGLEASFNEPASINDHYSILSAARELLLYGFKLPNARLTADGKMIIVERIDAPDIEDIAMDFIMTFDVDSSHLKTDVHTSGVTEEILDEIIEGREFEYNESEKGHHLFENIELSIFTRLTLVLANFYTTVTYILFNSEYNTLLLPQMEYLLDPSVKNVTVTVNGQHYMKLAEGSIWTFSKFNHSSDLIVTAARLFLKNLPECDTVNMVMIQDDSNPTGFTLAIDEF